jgi:hypothetical protein
MKILSVHFWQMLCAFFEFFVYIFFIFSFWCSLRSRYIRYCDDIGDNQYGESYDIGNEHPLVTSPCRTFMLSCKGWYASPDLRLVHLVEVLGPSGCSGYQLRIKLQSSNLYTEFE